MKKSILRLLFIAFCLFLSPKAYSALESTFTAINFVPAVDAGNYVTVYGSRTHKAWQGDLGFYFDYANRPLEFRSLGASNDRQSVIDHTLILNTYGALSFTDWFEMGINIPTVFYNWFITPDATKAEDNGGSMGDILVMAKFRFVDIDKGKIGLAVIPYITLPSGDTVRFNGNGSVAGGGKFVFDAKLHERLEVSLNVGALLRDDVTKVFDFGGGATSSVRIDDLFTYGAGINIKFSKNFQGIIEAQGSTVMRDFFGSSNTTSLESTGGVRVLFGDTGLALDAGAGAGLVEGVGTPRFRAYLGLRWVSPGPKECPVCKQPDPRIKDNKIVLWGKIFFDTAKDTIKPISYPVLDDVVDVLNSNPGISLVEVQGHTDWRGSDSYNLDLSQRRANSAMQYLISKGIDPSRLRAVGYGETRPIATNDTVEGMSQNRRVDFVIISSSGGYTSSPDSADAGGSANPQHNPQNSNSETDHGLPNYSG